VKNRAVLLVAAMMAGGNVLPVHAAENKNFISFKEVAPPYPSLHPPLNEQRSGRPGDVVYSERATGLPGARLTDTLVLKKTPFGRVTVAPSDHLLKHLLNGVPYFCALYPARDSKVEYGKVESDGWLERRKPGFYVCLKDGDGDAGTFEKVRIITVVLYVVDRKKTAREVQAVMHRYHEDTASGDLSPKAFSETTLKPDDGDHFDASITLKSVANGVIEFRSDLLDKDGREEARPRSVSVSATGPFPVMVSVPHPFEGDTLYRMGPNAAVEDRAAEEKQRERAAHIEILGVEGGAVTYRVVRTFMPWRYWVDVFRGKKKKQMRWRPRP
jgi:hypothetical protein